MSGRPLILAYHAVGAWSSPLAIPEKVLRDQLALLRQRGYVGLTAAHAERHRLAGTLHGRTVVVTFDDGFRSVLRARPILEELGFPGTVFVVTSFVESGEPLRWPGIERWSDSHAREHQPLRWGELEFLREAGWEVGSHTVNHPLLPDLGQTERCRELVESNRLLQARLGSCETVAYPYGRADESTAQAAADAGYLAGFALGTVHRPDERLRRPRLELRSVDTGLRLEARLSWSAELARRSAVAGAASRLRHAVGPRAGWLPSTTAQVDEARKYLK